MEPSFIALWGKINQGGLHTITSGGSGTAQISYSITFPTVNGKVFTELNTSSPNVTRSGCYNNYRGSFTASYYGSASNGTLHWVAYGW